MYETCDTMWDHVMSCDITEPDITGDHMISHGITSLIHVCCPRISRSHWVLVLSQYTDLNKQLQRTVQSASQWNSQQAWNHSWIPDSCMKRILSPPLLTVQWYNSSNKTIHSKYATLITFFYNELPCVLTSVWHHSIQYRWTCKGGAHM